METINVYYNDRIHKGKIVMEYDGYTFYELTDPFNWRLGKTLVKIKNN